PIATQRQPGRREATMPDQGALSNHAQQQSGELLAAARKGKQMGRLPIPIPLREKGPRLKGWTGLRLTDQQIEQEFGGAPKNIGFLLGEPSKGTIDVDLDCNEAVELAQHILPTTAEIFGRPSKPRSHYIYRSPDLTSHQFQDVDGSMIVEIRSTG